MKFFLFFSHSLTNQQIKDVYRTFGDVEIVNLPDNLRFKLSNVPPEIDDLGEYVKDFEKYLLENSTSGDLVLIQGEFGLVYRLVEFSKSISLIPIYATTKRITKEIIKDGKVVKISEFKHIRFRRY
ncbi:hypothetical protein FE773_08980 [Caminibacter mediatlanticus TB-2]|uniref:CRISPR-associated protein n=1 Tax=Caminibacter mediatlanticus TB-2 TaxID=391592 RepID=A0ABX5VAK0_9BACT|nr:CRISPR-associated protein Csx20 [Caminibacter mediatlanticus]QCT95320.1 hypothetical protein FE773_08980 [Caminibacter mediatlanticus TB-2]